MKIGEIERDVPLTPLGHGKWSKLFREMTPGDSIEIKCDGKLRRHVAQSIRGCAIMYRKRHEPEFKYAIRMDDEDKDKFRFWRLG